jgi:hypothetical protein
VESDRTVNSNFLVQRIYGCLQRPQGSSYKAMTKRFPTSSHGSDPLNFVTDCLPIVTAVGSCWAWRGIYSWGHGPLSEMAPPRHGINWLTSDEWRRNHGPVAMPLRPYPWLLFEKFELSYFEVLLEEYYKNLELSVNPDEYLDVDGLLGCSLMFIT